MIFKNSRFRTDKNFLVRISHRAKIGQNRTKSDEGNIFQSNKLRQNFGTDLESVTIATGKRYNRF